MLVNKKVLFIDFDGTLVDVSRRHYTVYKKITESLNVKPISKLRYWNRRRNGESFFDVMEAEYKIGDKQRLRRNYFSLIEKRTYLELDSLFKNVTKTLKRLRECYHIVLVSLRVSRHNLMWQIKKLNIADNFDEVLAAHVHKHKLITMSKFFKAKDKWLIGDTEMDIEAGKKCGCFTVGVYSGLRGRSYLNNFSPDYLIKDITMFQAGVGTW
ncbi:MAG: HAD hydrolase-like protein [Candidatus Omnitrophota bacterium]|nr:HAD hydrolase-like protein [Candidatus Omnitrophota bacterium]